LALQLFGAKIWAKKCALKMLMKLTPGGKSKKKKIITFKGKDSTPLFGGGGGGERPHKMNLILQPLCFPLEPCVPS